MTVQKFSSDDEAFLKWMEAHPNGYVVNTGRGKNSDYYLLHRSGCTHIARSDWREPGGFTERRYIKVCGEDLQALADWGQRNKALDGAPFSGYCSSCNPVPQTYLMVWNSNNWDWADLQSQVERLNAGEELVERWSCGANRSILPGSRFFLIRVGDENRGLIGSGRINTAPTPDSHWDNSQAEEGKQAWYVTLSFDTLSELPLVSWQELESDDLSPIRKQIRSSGTSLPPHCAVALELLWAGRTSPASEDYPDEIPQEVLEKLVEGAKKTVVVNQYERDPKARHLCIQHWKPICVVCGFDFNAVYGAHGKGFIHVHHLKPISQIGQSYEVDPIEDLRPVCPNCHAMLHRGKETMSVERLAHLVAQTQSS